MRITSFVAIAFIFCLPKATAQDTKTFQLKPIHKQGWKYFYGGKKMNSVYALQIPLEALDNTEINERFRKFKKLQVLGGWSTYPCLSISLPTDMVLEVGVTIDP